MIPDALYRDIFTLNDQAGDFITNIRLDDIISEITGVGVINIPNVDIPLIVGELSPMTHARDRIHRNLLNPFYLQYINKKIENFGQIINNDHHKFRELKDNSTDSYVQTFFADNDLFAKMIIYIYGYIQYNIDYIIRNMTDQLTENEKILFFFKGGNIMHIYREMFDKILLGSAPFNNPQNSVFTNLHSKTKISDNDYTIYIITQDIMRYNVIYNIFKNKLIIILLEISEIFDELFNNPDVVHQEPHDNDKLHGPVDFLNYKKFKHNIMWLFNSYYTSTKKTDYLDSINRKLTDGYEGPNHIFIKKEAFIDEIIYSLIPGATPEYQIKKSIFVDVRDHVYPPVQLRQFGISRHHFISVNNVIYNNLSKAGHSVNFDLYRIKLNIKLDMVNQTTGEQEETSIPSEFIDVSIPRYDDLNLIEFRRKFYPQMNNNNITQHINADNWKSYITRIRILRGNIPNAIVGTLESNIHIYTMTYKYIIDDLFNTLYIQNTYCPLLDSKYKKRLLRIFYFLILYYKSTVGKSIVSLGYIFENLYNLNFDYFINDTLYEPLTHNPNIIHLLFKKKIYEYYNFNDDYDLIKPLLNFTFLFYKLRAENNNTKKMFIDYYNNMYNIINCDIRDFFTKFDIYVNDIREQIEMICNYLVNIIRQNTAVRGGNPNNDGNTNTGPTMNKPKNFNSKNISKIFIQFEKILRKKGI